MKSIHIIKINAQGGIFTPLKLKSIVEIAFKAGAQNINFGPRQEIFLNIDKEGIANFDFQMKDQNIEYELDKDEFPNIVSSYPAEGIFSGDYWLTEGIYKDVFDQFDYTPKLRINISDNDQTLVPFFTGELNFIASGTYQYWFLYLNLKEQNQLVRWNKLIYSTDIPKISKAIENVYLNDKISNSQEIISLINKNTNLFFREIDKELELPRFDFPYYEGLNLYGDKLWLGVYRRDYMFPIPFIHELCTLCIQSNIGQLCTTPWRTLMIKGIDEKHRILWEKLVGKHGINLRHSTTELNWVVEDINSSELSLKRYIISQLSEKDIRTSGLVFGIKLHASKYIAASVIITEKPLFRKGEPLLLSSYDIHFTENFNPNSPNSILFAKNVSKHNLLQKLLELCKRYYETLNEIDPIIIVEQSNPTNVEEVTLVYQCKNCFTIYDQRFGDEFNHIKPNTPFSMLSGTFICPTCEAPKEDFFEILYEELTRT